MSQKDVDQRIQDLEECARNGHDYMYIDDTAYRWDCQRCGWQEFRSQPSLPLNPHGGWVAERTFADELPARKYAAEHGMKISHRRTFEGEQWGRRA